MFAICACSPERVRLYARPPGEHDYRLLGEVNANGIANPCALAEVAELFVSELGWGELAAMPSKSRADPREMAARLDAIMSVLTSTSEALTAAEIASRLSTPLRHSEVYRQLRNLIGQGVVARSTSKPYTYRPSKLRKPTEQRAS